MTAHVRTETETQTYGATRATKHLLGVQESKPPGKLSCSILHLLSGQQGTDRLFLILCFPAYFGAESKPLVRDYSAAIQFGQHWFGNTGLSQVLQHVLKVSCASFLTLAEPHITHSHSVLPSQADALGMKE